jgi:hypothetical protein
MICLSQLGLFLDISGREGARIDSPQWIYGVSLSCDSSNHTILLVHKSGYFVVQLLVVHSHNGIANSFHLPRGHGLVVAR